MPKHGVFTPKGIANAMKAKGLSRLKWYCQMCQKQCRDENGFKCHQTSESHKRQMLVFGQNPKKFVDGFSDEFERGIRKIGPGKAIIVSYLVPGFAVVYGAVLLDESITLGTLAGLALIVGMRLSLAGGGGRGVSLAFASLLFPLLAA